jgi:glycogen operon protein
MSKHQGENNETSTIQHTEHVNADSWTVGSYLVERGKPLPYGASEMASGINFSLFSRNSLTASLVLYWPEADKPVAEIPLDPFLNRTGNVWHILVRRLDPDICYGWRLDGPNEPHNGHRFDKKHLLFDPYARALSGGSVWSQPEISREIECAEEPSDRPPRMCRLEPEGFDWQGDAPPRIPMEDSIIYELHVRGFTIHNSSRTDNPGTFLGLTEKIPYLKELGVTAVELMPVFEFDENENLRHHPRTGELLRNFWGYSPIAFFAPKSSYAANGHDGNQINEFREMVRRFHRAGIEVYLDVVFNHTAEGNEKGPTISFRGIDNSIYYMLDKQGNYRNFSGCGNTLNCNHPLIREIILDCLQYWVSDMHVDGFRFDLASILGRGPDGEVLANPPLLERIALDPVLADTKIIAEAWDAAGLNQVGKFPSWGRWAEWNGYFRDQMRLFWQGQNGLVSAVASRICGSDDLYEKTGRSPYHSINFITAHDGFTMNDLVSYKEKHNHDNGEDNIDGEVYNHSMNFGTEGATGDQHISRLRRKQMKNFFATLLLSQGVPMLLAGDEFCKTQNGNNNAYCQDNELSWINWELAEKNADMVRFVRLMNAFRKRHHSLRRKHFFKEGASDISWHGEKAYQPDWSENARWMAFILDGDRAPGGRDKHIMVMMNASEDWRHFEIPDKGGDWRRIIDTSKQSPEDFFEKEADAPIIGRRHDRYAVESRSVVVLVCG